MTVDHKEISITRCHNCGEIIHKVTAEGIIGKPNGHKCKKTYEQLLDENEAQAKELAEMREEIKWLRNEVELSHKTIMFWDDSETQRMEQVKQLQADKAAAVEALRWYAERDNHEIMRRIGGDFAPITLDKGQRARAAIERLEGRQGSETTE